jgi:uncharacterized protein YraI
MTLKTILFGAASALVLSAGAANAVPATAETSLNVRSGPGTQSEVVGTIRAGETVDARDCTGSWCRVSFSGGSGFSSRSYLAMGGGGPAVAVAPGVVYDEPYDDYYDYGYAYGPSVGFGVYASPGYRYRHGWRGGRHWQGGGHWAGRPGGGHWAGRPGGGNWAGRPGGGRPGGGWAGRPGGINPGIVPGTVTPRPGMAGVPRGGGMAVGGGRPQVSAPAGMGRGGAIYGGGRPGGGGAAIGGGRVGGGGGGPAVGAGAGGAVGRGR